MEWGEFFNSDLGKSLTNIGTQALGNALNLTGSGNKSKTQIQAVQPIVQTQASMLSGNNIYWIAGGGVVLILAIVLIVKR